MAPNRNRSLTRCNNTDYLHSTDDQEIIQQRAIRQNRKQLQSLISDQQLVTAIWNNEPFCATLQPLICGEGRTTEPNPQSHPRRQDQSHLGDQTGAQKCPSRQEPPQISIGVD